MRKGNFILGLVGRGIFWVAGATFLFISLYAIFPIIVTGGNLILLLLLHGDYGNLFLTGIYVFVFGLLFVLDALRAGFAYGLGVAMFDLLAILIFTFLFIDRLINEKTYKRIVQILTLFFGFFGGFIGFLLIRFYLTSIKDDSVFRTYEGVFGANGVLISAITLIVLTLIGIYFINLQLFHFSTSEMSGANKNVQQ